MDAREALRLRRRDGTWLLVLALIAVTPIVVGIARWGVALLFPLAALERNGLAELVTTVVACAAVWLIAAPALLYRRARTAITWGRYRPALRAVRAVRALSYLWLPNLREALRVEEATVLAGLGRMSEALAMLEPIRGAAPDGEERYARHLPRLYDHARRFDEMRQAQRAIAERHRDEAAPWIELALTEVLRFGRTVEARAALDHARTLPATELGRAFAEISSSICSLYEGTPRSALAEVDEARASLARATTPLARASIDNLAEWVRGCCLAELDEVEQATEILSAARPMLLAAREHALVDEAEQRLAWARERRAARALEGSSAR